jgi:hypothetical protein
MRYKIITVSHASARPLPDFLAGRFPDLAGETGASRVFLAVFLPPNGMANRPAQAGHREMEDPRL